MRTTATIDVYPFARSEVSKRLPAGQLDAEQAASAPSSRVTFAEGSLPDTVRWWIRSETHPSGLGRRLI
jgi:hypothetical protein